MEVGRRKQFSHSACRPSCSVSWPCKLRARAMTSHQTFNFYFGSGSDSAAPQEGPRFCCICAVRLAYYNQEPTCGRCFKAGKAAAAAAAAAAAPAPAAPAPAPAPAPAAAAPESKPDQSAAAAEPSPSESNGPEPDSTKPTAAEPQVEPTAAADTKVPAQANGQ